MAFAETEGVCLAGQRLLNRRHVQEQRRTELRGAPRDRDQPILRGVGGVSFGNPSGSTNFVEGQEHLRDSVIRNNVIVPGPDAGIELWWARNIGVYNNAVWREDAAGPGLRGGMSEWKIEGIRVTNNLVWGTNMLDGDVFQESNLFGDLAGCSLDWSRLVFLCGPEVAGIQGKSLEEVQDDFNGKRRGRTPDRGAFERAEEG
jgi:hypothetical protein